MGEPSIYFPENIYYRFGIKEGRIWSTNVAVSPDGRSQRRKLWIRPKRQFQATLYPTVRHGFIVSVDGRTNDPGSPPLTLTDEDIWGTKVMPFLDSVAGRYQNFYIFSPKKRFLWEYRVGHWNGGGLPLPILFPDDLPFKFDFRGPYLGLANFTTATLETLSLVPDVDGEPVGTPLVYVPADFNINTVGTGQETQLYALTPTIGPAFDPGLYHVYVNVSDAFQRIPAVMTTDQEDVGFDWSGAEPPTQLTIDLEEDWG